MPRNTHWTPEQYREYLRRKGLTAMPATAKPEGAEKSKPSRPGPNKTEQEYRRLYLDASERDGSVVRFQPFRVYLSNGHSYRPDWGVFWPNGAIECHEVKGGHIRSRDSRILFDTARANFPWWSWVWAQKQAGGVWKVQMFGERESQMSTTRRKAAHP